jgi:hypothetical protein
MVAAMVWDSIGWNNKGDNMDNQVTFVKSENNLQAATE